MAGLNLLHVIAEDENGEEGGNGEHWSGSY